MLSKLFSCLLCVFFLTGGGFLNLNNEVLAQKKLEKFIKTHITEIKSISIADENYDDLTNLGNAIGEARVVMLGEQEHGDGTTFEAKARLVKYLHEKKGFNVLAFESDFWALTAGYDATTKGAGSIEQHIKGNIFPIWTECPQFKPMKSYLMQSQKTSTPVKVVGFDNQIHGRYSKQNLYSFIEKFIIQANLPFSKTASYPTFLTQLDSLIGVVNQNNADNFPKPFFKKLEVSLSTISQEIEATPFKNSFEHQTIKSILSLVKHFKIRTDGFQSLFIERDKQMAENLLWLMQEKYPAEKILVWAANGHVIKNALDNFEPKAYRHESMGRIISQSKGFETYVLGFTSYEGTSGMVTYPKGKINLPNLQDTCIERWFEATKHAYSFVDFKQFNRENPKFNTPFWMNGEGHRGNLNDWTKAFDGVFFIKTMKGCI
jgi:erythromycin esterase